MVFRFIKWHKPDQTRVTGTSSAEFLPKLDVVAWNQIKSDRHLAPLALCSFIIWWAGFDPFSWTRDEEGRKLIIIFLVAFSMRIQSEKIFGPEFAFALFLCRNKTNSSDWGDIEAKKKSLIKFRFRGWDFCSAVFCYRRSFHRRGDEHKRDRNSLSPVVTMRMNGMKATRRK